MSLCGRELAAIREISPLVLGQRGDAAGADAAYARSLSLSDTAREPAALEPRRAEAAS
jgi:hypothetical protein